MSEEIYIVHEKLASQENLETSPNRYSTTFYEMFNGQVDRNRGLYRVISSNQDKLIVLSYSSDGFHDKPNLTFLDGVIPVCCMDKNTNAVTSIDSCGNTELLGKVFVKSLCPIEIIFICRGYTIIFRQKCKENIHDFKALIEIDKGVSMIMLQTKLEAFSSQSSYCLKMTLNKDLIQHLRNQNIWNSLESEYHIGKIDIRDFFFLLLAYSLKWEVPKSEFKIFLAPILLLFGLTFAAACVLVIIQKKI